MANWCAWRLPRAVPMRDAIRRPVSAGARKGLALALVVALAGCSFAPPYRPPVTAAPIAFKEAGPWRPAHPADAGPAADWWTAFGDPELDRLEATIAASNPSYAGALGRYEQAQAYLAQAKAVLLPTVNIGTGPTGITANKQSANRPLRSPSQPTYYAADTVAGDVSYELDLWGRVRNGVAAGKAEVQASGDDLAALRLSLERQLASTYLALRGYDQQLILLGQTVDAYGQADALTQRRFKGGIASALDTGRSGAILGEAQAQLADVKAARALAEHAIGSLVGVEASTFSLPPAKIAFTLPDIPVGLPSTLLQRRPDVAAAERRMFAANAEIGVAKAAFFPSISLGGQGGFQNTGLPSLFTAPNIFWSIGPSAVLNLFDGGRRRAQVAIARAAWDQATADYRGAVLTALQEVEDQLATLHHLDDEAAAENRALDGAATAERTALNRYNKGATDYLEVVTAQATALRIRRTVLDLSTRRLQASARLMIALGGGWQASSG